MCGVAGFIGKHERADINSRLLDRLNEALVHRGPDGEGIWTSRHFGVGLAHRRLSIIDTSINGRGPMVSYDGMAVISFNGEIYNHRALRAELEKKGYTYRSQTDTETVLYAYQEWGIACVHKLEGMFAFALFDKRCNELFLVRDRIGIKPLYVTAQGDYISFASEIKALWQLPWITRSINNLAVYHALTFLSAPAPWTVFEGIYKLPAGFYAKVDATRNISFHEWYTPLTGARTLPPEIFEHEDCVTDHVETLVTDSIRTRMMSDVPFGVFLSGGIDSSLNVALMSQFTSRIKTFNVVFEDGLEYDERAWAHRVSKQFDTDHHELVISQQDARNFFDTMFYHQDEPLADWVCIPLYFVAKLAKDAGVTVVQCGEGADELFFGYDAYARFFDMYTHWWRSTQRYAPTFLRKMVAQIAQYMPIKPGYQEYLYNWAHNRELFWSGAIAFKEQIKRSVFAASHRAYDDGMVEKIYQGMSTAYDSHDIVSYHVNTLRTSLPHGDYAQRMLYLELKHRLPELLLMRLDKMCMATSIEGRVPYLDHRLVEYALAMPVKMKYTNREKKYILKQVAQKYLPHELIYRKKVGFAAPVNKWLRTSSFIPAKRDAMIDASYMHTLAAQHASGSDNAAVLWTAFVVQQICGE